MSSKLQLDVRHLNRLWRHLVNAYEVRQAWCLLQVKLCDPCLSDLKWFVYHMHGDIQVLGFLLFKSTIILLGSTAERRDCERRLRVRLARDVTVHAATSGCRDVVTKQPFSRHVYRSAAAAAGHDRAPCPRH